MVMSFSSVAASRPVLQVRRFAAFRTAMSRSIHKTDAERYKKLAPFAVPAVALPQTGAVGGDDALPLEDLPQAPVAAEEHLVADHSQPGASLVLIVDGEAFGAAALAALGGGVRVGAGDARGEEAGDDAGAHLEAVGHPFFARERPAHGPAVRRHFLRGLVRRAGAVVEDAERLDLVAEPRREDRAGLLQLREGDGRAAVAVAEDGERALRPLQRREEARGAPGVFGGGFAIAFGEGLLLREVVAELEPGDTVPRDALHGGEAVERGGAEVLQVGELEPAAEAVRDDPRSRRRRRADEPVERIREVLQARAAERARAL